MADKRTDKWVETSTGAEIGVGFSAGTTAPAAHTTGTALQRLKPVDIIEPPQVPRRRASATFIAQLIATERQLPQTRERRRAEPHEVLAAYGAVARMVGR